MLNFFNIFKLQLRQEKFRIIMWTIVLAGISVIELGELAVMFSDPADMQGMYATLAMPSMVAMFGPIWQSAATATTAGIFGSIMPLFLILLAAVMNIFLVARYTRSDEESGNHEMLRALPVGHHTLLPVTLKLAASVNVLIGVVTFAGLVLIEQVQLSSVDVSGAFCYSLVVALGGMLFASIAAIFAQIFASARYTIAASAFALGVLYLIRALTDIHYTETHEESIGSWLNPLALALRSKPYVENNYWVLGVLFALILALSTLAVALYSIRDLDQSFVQDRSGRESAKSSLSGFLGLSWRLQRGTLIGWGISLFVVGAVYGSIMPQMESFIAGNELFAQALKPKEGHSVVELFISMIITVMALMACIPALNSALFALKEEGKGRTEQLWAKSLSRYKVISISIAQGFTTAIVMLFLIALGLFAATEMSMTDPIGVGNIMSDTFVYLPATLVLVAVATLMVGIGVRFGQSITYAYFAYSFFVMYIGKILNLPEWTGKITPFGHVPDLINDAMNWTPIILTSAVAIALASGSVVLFRRIDVF